MNLTCSLCNHLGELIPWDRARGLLQCPRCRLIFYGAEDPSLAAAGLYNESYFHDGEYADYSGDQAIHSLNFKRPLATLQKLKPSGDLFEIGCAYGLFLNMAKSIYRVRGNDVTPEGLAYAKKNFGVHVTEGDFLTLPDEPSSQDIVCMWDTIEHLPKPIETIEKAASWLRPGGILALSTGDIGSFVAKTRGKRWRMIHPPTHLYYFSKATITMALEKAGLKVVSFSHPPIIRNLNSMAQSVYKLKGKEVPNWAKKLPHIHLKLNLFDVMHVMAQKI